MINFLTLKWGTKYGAEYVNRLHNSLKIHYKKPFRFVCITDDPTDLNCETLPLSDFNLIRADGVFTSKKLELFKKFTDGKYCLLDVDILVTQDVTKYFDEYDFVEPRIIFNRWQNYSRLYVSYFNIDCYINSSFVTWKDNQLEWLFDLFVQYLPIVQYKYKSLDKFIFYSSFEKLKFHPDHLVYAYSYGASYPDDIEPFKYRPEYSIVLFHTSHNKAEGIELHDAQGWAKDMWVGYDAVR